MEDTICYKDLQNEKYPGLDVLKFFLALIVCMRHIGQGFLETSELLFSVFVNILSPIAVPTFFVISGFLFYKNGCKLKKTVYRLLKLYLIWSVIFLPINIVRLFTGSVNIITFIKEFFFVGTYYHLWFLPALVIGILINYLFRKLPDLLIFFIFLGLFLVTVLSEPYRFLCTNELIYFFQLYEKIFVTFRNVFFMAPIFVFEGKLLMVYLQNDKHKYSHIYLFLLISCVMYFGEAMFVTSRIYTRGLNVLLTPIFFSPILILSFLRVNNEMPIELRKSSTFLFCFHPIILIIQKYLFIGEHNFFIMLVLTLMEMVLLTFLYVVFSEKSKYKYLKMLY